MNKVSIIVPVYNIEKISCKMFGQPNKSNFRRY